MIEPSNDPSTTKTSPHSDVVTTRVNVAFPFSQIKVEEPSEDVAALAVLVRDLADVIAEVAPGPKVQELTKRARALVTRLK